ncbi:MAG: peptidoglycan DD-metalloendopeptidase family protein, partial [Oscillospiraceae bacterium]|nr:peptidoglycan DD-metalloendopeptidase family protein [Oscillospiraceae bacterium]
EIAARKAELEEISKQMQTMLSEINSQRYEHLSATAKKNVLDDQIGLMEAKIAKSDELIATYSLMIEQKQLEVDAAKRREDEQWALYKERVRKMEENGAISYLAVIFDASSYSDLLERIDGVGDIMRSDESTYREYVAATQETVAAKEDLEATKAEQEVEKAAQLVMLDELSVKLVESVALVKAMEDALESSLEQYHAKEAESAKMQEEINAKEAELRRQEEAARNAGKSSGTVKGSGQLSWPSASSNVVTSLFGTRLHPLYGYYRSHNGIDIGAKYGTSILAADSGTVITSAYNSSFGNYVVISHGNGMTTLYAHMSARKVKEGDGVSTGQLIGLVGSTGASTGPHLHFEVAVSGSRVNPLAYFSGGYIIRE